MENSIQLSWFLQTIPSLLMIMAFLIENIAVGFGWASLGTGYFCDAVAFCAVTTVITLNGTSTTIAFLTYRLMATRKTPSASWAIAGNALSWLFGILMATILLKERVYGSYRGLYCCVREESLTKIRVALVPVVFASAIIAQTFFYWSSFQKAQAHSRGVPTARSTSHEPQGIHQSLALVVLKRGLEMIIIFYLTWILIAFDALATFFGHNANMWTSIVAAWMAKIGLVIHCAVMYRSLKRFKKQHLRITPYMNDAFTSQAQRLTTQVSRKSLLRSAKVASAGNSN